MHPIVAKTALVAVICEAGAARHELVGSLRQLGFDHVTPLSTVQEFSNFIRNDPVDWVIATVMNDQDKNFLHLLDIVLTRKLHEKIKVSVICGNEEAGILPVGFELGLLSWHDNDFTRDRLQQNLGELTRMLYTNKENLVLTSAHFLRKHLYKARKTDSLVHLETSLIEHFPGQPDLLVNLATGLLEGGNIDEAFTVMNQAVFLNKALETTCKSIYEDYLRRNPRAATHPQNGLGGIESAVVVDPDEAIRQQVKTMLNELGIHAVAMFEDGEQALEEMRKKGAPDLLLMEWRLPKITGPALIQRLREKTFRKTALVLISSLVQPEDKILVSEMNVANIIPKPLERQEFLLGLRWTLKQRQRPTEQIVLEKAILEYLEDGRVREAERLKSGYLANGKISEGRKMLMRAHFEYYKENYELAKNYVVAAIKASGTEALPTINLLGRVLLKLGDHKSALKCFERANVLSPKNIERLCTMAEIHLQDGDNSEAAHVISQAKGIDEGSQRVKETEIKHAIIAEDGNLEQAAALFKEIAAKGEIVRFSNNRAVAYIHDGEYKKAIDLYKTTIAALPSNEQKLRTILHYNLALAYARTDRLDPCAEQLNLALLTGEGKVKSKANSLLKRVQKAVRQKIPLELRIDNAIDLDAELGFETIGGEESTDSIKPIFDPFAKDKDEIQAGAACLHKIFKNQDELDEYARRLLDSFHKRGLAA